MSPVVSLAKLVLFLCCALMAFDHQVFAAPGDVDAGFNPNVGATFSTVNSTAVQPDGRILIGGNFTSVGGVTRNYIARINPDGAVDAGFNPNVGGIVHCSVVLGDGKVLIGGSFTAVGGVARNCMARINSDGTLDTSFNPNVDGITPSVYTMLVQPDGKIVLAGDFTTLGGVTRNNIARLNSNGSLDAGFNPNAGGTVYSATLQTDGKIVIGGSFFGVGGGSVNYLARVNADGTRDMGFNPNANSNVYCATVQMDGRILIGGVFDSVGAVTRNGVARVNIDGTLDTGFNPNANGTVYSMALQADGKIVIGGSFNTVGAVTRNYIARLNSDGVTDSGFNPNANNTVDGAMLQADGKILIGGDFTSVGGVTRNRLARLDNDAAAQSLTVPSTNRLQWLRSGASAEAANVTFELSADGGNNWTLLGAATRISGGWELTGLSLPVGGQIRARARIPGGESSGSSGLVEAIVPFGVQPEIAVEQPALTSIADGGSKDFGSVQVGSNTSLTFTIKNTGNANLTGLGITFDGANASDFTLAASPTALVTGPTGSTTFTVRFAPGAAGARTATLHIASNDADENPFDINLTGTATAPDIAVEQPALTSVPDGGTKAFGNVLTGTSTSLVFTIKNTGVGDLTGLGITFDGPNASEFSVTASPVIPVTGPTGSTTFTVQFAPTSAGAKTAALHIASNVTGTKNPYDINITGTATAPEIAVEQPSGTDIPDGGSRGFGSMVIGSNTSLTFTVRNSGNGNLTGLGITLDGANASEFAVTTNPTAPVAGPSGTTTFVVRFAPTTAGSKTAALHIANNDADENPFDINLTGTATGPEIAVEQPALTDIPDGGGKSFGNVPVGSNGILTFTIRNTGNGDLTGLVVTKDGVNATDFVVTTNPTAPVTAGASTTFTVRFTPGATGLRTAAIHIANNDADENPFDIALTGTGTGAGTAEAAFNPDVSGYVLGMALQQDGRIVVAGGFTSVGGTVRNYMARINAGGTLDPSFDPNANDWVYSIALQKDGGMLIGGTFTTVGGVVRNYFARLNTNGTVDSGFHPIVNDWVFSTALQADGKILIGGSFTAVEGVTRNRIARLNANGTLDSAFNADLDGEIYSIALQADGKIVVGGIFTAAGGVARNRVARINADGTLDAGFNPNANGGVYNTAVQADGKILMGGNFTAMSGSTRNHLARVNTDGTLDSFNPNVNGDVDSMAVQTDGKVIIGGSFTALGAATRNYLARVNADGTPDTVFNPNASGAVYGVSVQPDGKIFIGGDFTNVGGVSANRFTRLENDAATQSLTVPNTSRLQWLRGGTSPETIQVTFDLSTDGGINWTLLGAGNRSRLVTGWELAGLSLPTSGLVRARAPTTGGYSNCSSGFVETVAAITALPNTPEIVVEQPALTNLVDGGNRSLGNVLTGSITNLTFTIRNTGNANLTGLGVTIDGGNASDFTVTASPSAPVTGPTGSTTFTLRFAPASSGAKVAALHIASNDADESPFDINLSGRAFTPGADDDGDGITNTTELALATLGFDPLVNNSDLRTTLQANALGLSLYTASDIQALALGSPLLERNTANGHFYLSISVEKSPNLIAWVPLLNFSPSYDALSGKIILDITPDASNAQFYRVLGAKP